MMIKTGVNSKVNTIIILIEIDGSKINNFKFIFIFLIKENLPDIFLKEFISELLFIIEKVY